MKKETSSNINREMSHEQWGEFTKGWTQRDWQNFWAVPREHKLNIPQPRVYPVNDSRISKVLITGGFSLLGIGFKQGTQGQEKESVAMFALGGLMIYSGMFIGER